MVKDLSFPDRLRIPGNTILKEIGTREKEAKKVCLLIHMNMMLWFYKGTVFQSSLQTGSRPAETPDATGWRRSCQIAWNETTWRLLKLNKNLARAKNAPGVARDWGCWARSLQEGQAVLTDLSQKFHLYEHGYRGYATKNCMRRED